jgi:hypothetical protein
MRSPPANSNRSHPSWNSLEEQERLTQRVTTAQNYAT